MSIRALQVRLLIRSPIKALGRRAMKYMIIGSEARGEFEGLPPEEQSKRIQRHQQALNDLLRERVVAGRRGLIFVSVGLGPFHGGTHDTVTVRNRDGKRLRIDGPFAETKE